VGERVFGKAFFEENTGYFWGLIETRPYMRAREGLGRLLGELGKYDEAQAHYRAMLELNPSDNQGIRYLLTSLLLKLDRNQETLDLLNQFKEDGTANALYSRALVEFRVGGGSKAAEKALQEALQQNPFVPDYLGRKKRLPTRLPRYMGFGNEDEAIHYAAEHRQYWAKTQGALDWLKRAAEKK